LINTQYSRFFRRSTLRILSAAGFMLAVALTAAGEEALPATDLRELSIEELMTIEVQTVYSTSRHEQKVSEAPSSVTIITAEDIRHYGYRTLADILKSIRGFAVTYDRNYHYLGTRGFGRPGDNNTRVLLLLDGHRLNDNVHDAASLGTEFILDLDLIERIEVSRGPSSSLYGSNAFFGVINIITRNGAELKGAELSGEAGSFGQGKGRVSGGRGWQSGGETLFSGTAYRRKGENHYFREYDPGNPFFDPRAGNDGIAEGRDYDRYHSIFSKTSLFGFTLQGACSSRTKGIPTASYGTDFNSDSKTMDQRAYVDMSSVRRIAEEADLSLRIFYDFAESRADYLYSGIVNKDRSLGEWAGGEVQLSSLLLDTHRVIVGAEYIGSLRQDQENADQEPVVPYLNDERRSRRWAGYIQDEFAWGTTFRFSAGARYDHASLVNGTANPRMAAIFNPGEGSTVKLLYGSAFRSPSVHELYYQVPSAKPPLVANPGLKPEKIKTYELVYEQYLVQGVRATIDGYYYRIDDLIEQTRNEAGSLVFINLEAAEARGIELEVEKTLSRGATGRASYSLQRATNVRTGEVLNNSARNMAKLNLAFPLMKDFVFGLEEQYTGRRKTEAGTSIGSFAVTNATLLGRNAAGNLEFSLNCYNLFNKQYSDPAGADLSPINAVAQDGRTFRIKGTYAF